MGTTVLKNCDRSRIRKSDVIISEEDVIPDLASKTDEQLMVLYQQGEYAAFDELYFRHSGRVYAFLKSKVSRPGEAEDLLQQAFLKLHQHRSSYDATLPFLPWIFSITRNAVVDHLRKHKPTAMEQEKLISIADRRENSETGKKDESLPSWQEVMKLLPEEQQRLIQLRYEEGLSFEEIARLSGVNESSARKRLSRTIQGLRKMIVGKGVGR